MNSQCRQNIHRDALSCSFAKAKPRRSNSGGFLRNLEVVFWRENYDLARDLEAAGINQPAAKMRQNHHTKNAVKRPRIERRAALAAKLKKMKEDSKQEAKREAKMRR